jgi:hypothetical protein
MESAYPIPANPYNLYQNNANMISNLLISLLQNRLFLLYTKFNNKCSGIPETFSSVPGILHSMILREGERWKVLLIILI